METDLMNLKLSQENTTLAVSIDSQAYKDVYKLSSWNTLAFQICWYFITVNGSC